jgi:hypothetical protein
MTFEDDLSVQEYKSNPYTQDIAKSKDNKAFQQSPMMRIEHEDPGLHYIGEALPKPGDSEATWAGRGTSVGFSPIVARADHTHDTFLRYSVSYSSSAVVCPPGQTLITHTLLRGENYYDSGTSGSLLVMPQRGVWFVNTSLNINRAGGGTFTGEANIVFFYVNGTFSRIPYRNSLANIPTFYNINASDFIHYNDGSIGVNATVELAYQHSDVVNHEVSVAQLTITRLADL